jgi:3-(3-hydroxy-phenyl)propionate hydroxylase
MQAAAPGFQYRIYQPQLPPLLAGRETKRHDVMICGGGPVGLALALALAEHGIASVVVDADTTVCQGSRAICLSRRTLDILDRLGVVDGFLQKGLGWTRGRSFYRTAEVLAFDMPHGSDDRFYPMTNIAQYDIEQFLVDAIARHRDLIELRWGTELKGVTPDNSGAEVTLSAAGESYRSQARWLVACDGARSKVRQELGLRMQGTAYEGRYVIVDVHVELDWPTERLAWFDPASNPGRTMLMHRQPGDIWRIDYQLHDGEDADAMTTPERVTPVVDAHFRMLGVDRPWRLIWSSSYRASALSLDTYVHGNVVFAGDAAHLVPIFGVRGLNSGFEDIFNLGWKLARILKGTSPPALLDSYSRERRGAWAGNIAHAMKSTEFMAPPSRGFALMRDAVLSLAEWHGELRSLINPRQSSVIAYDDSPLNVQSPDEHGFADAARPGTVIPECPVRVRGEPSFLTRHLGNGFTLIVFPDRDMRGQLDLAALDLKLLVVASDKDAVAAQEGVDILIDPDGRCRRAFDAEPAAVYLVRPDGYICARWRTLDRGGLERALRVATANPAFTDTTPDQARVVS